MLTRTLAARWPRHRSPSFFAATRQLEAEIKAKDDFQRARVARLDREAHGWPTDPLAEPAPQDVWRWRSKLTLHEAAAIKSDKLLSLLICASSASKKLPGYALLDLADYRYVLDAWLRFVTAGDRFRSSRCGEIGPEHQMDIALALQTIRKWIAEAETSIDMHNRRATR